MSGAASGPGCAGLPPPEGEIPPVAVVPWGAGGWALVLQPSAALAQVLAALERMPAGVVFAEAFGDTDVLLTFEAGADTAPSRREAAGAVVRAVLGAGRGHDRGDAGRWASQGEREAYRAGWDEAFAAVRHTVFSASGAPPWAAAPAADPDAGPGGR